MVIQKAAVAGTLESSDVYVTAEPGEELEIRITSVVQQQFGAKIRACVEQTLQELGVTGGTITLNDRGALDCVISARVETAVKRAQEVQV